MEEEDIQVEDEEAMEAAEEVGEQPMEGADAEEIGATSGNYNSKTVNDKIFEELHVGKDLALEVQVSWKAFLNAAESREAAGEAIYAALFDAAPSLQGLFKTPRAIMAMRFMNGVSSIIASLHDPKGLKIVVASPAACAALTRCSASPFVRWYSLGADSPAPSALMCR